MDAADLIRRALEQREFWAELPGGRKVRLRAPAQLELLEFNARGSLLERVGRLCRVATAWQGFTEATILGAAHGSGDTEAPFSADLLELYLRDRPEEFIALQKALGERIKADQERREREAKNSAPSSTA